MKKTLLFSLFVLGAVVMSFAQSSIQININHLLGADAFEFDKTVQTDQRADVSITRMEYYLSEFTIVHDGGIETLIEDSWVLVNAGEPTQIEFPLTGVTEIEKIKFGIGVNEAVNNLDPATYPADHPLAPKSPSMHWGWASGYRFVALEGKCGANLSEIFQLHGLFNENYFSTEIEVDAGVDGDKHVVTLNADYTTALNGIRLSSGVIAHGINEGDLKCLENLRDVVFTPAAFVVNTEEIISTQLNLFPNPTGSGSATLTLSEPFSQELELRITNTLGQEVSRLILAPNTTEMRIDVPSEGTYFLQLLDAGQVLKSETLIAN